jgi:hypothetical protein
MAADARRIYDIGMAKKSTHLDRGVYGTVLIRMSGFTATVVIAR